MADFWKKKATEATILSDAAEKIVVVEHRPEGASYNPLQDNMRVQNVGWDTLDLANVAGGVEENRDLSDGEIVSFHKALADLLASIGDGP